MYKKFINMFIINNISKFLLIIFCITLSLTWFIISDNLASNIQNLISNDAKPVLWWDIKIEANKKLNTNQIKYLENLVNEKKIVLSKKIQTYSTIVDNKDNPDLVSLVFVDNNYPLYWNLEIEGKTKWVFVSQNIVDLFVKDNEIEVYGKKYNVWWVIIDSPWSWFNFFDDWKKILLDINEFDLLNIEKLWARIDREYLIKVNNPKNFDIILSDLKQWEFFKDVKIRDYKKWAERFQDIFSELEKFIKYITIISFILTILIIFLSVESFYLSNKKNFSILRILGLNSKSLVLFNIMLFLAILLLSIVVSTTISEVVFSIIRTFEISSSFYINSFSIYKTFILWTIILLLSVLFPLFKFLSNNPLAWLKENFLQIYSKKEIFVEICLILIGLIFIYSLTIWGLISWIYFTFILSISVLIISIILRYILIFVYKISSKLKKNYFSFYDSIRNTIKPWNLSTLISFSFIVSFSSLIFILIISFNFLDKLNLDLKNNDNIYIINITESDLEKIDDKYKNSSYSLILWRILNVNDKTLKEHIWNSWRFSREFNITDSDLEDIKILKWDKIKSWEVSIDSDFGKSLKLNIWDELEFLIYGIKKKLIVSNIRESIWWSVKPFFYFQVYKGDFDDFPKKYFLSTYIEPSEIKDFKNDFLNKTWNNISFIELDKIIWEIKEISKKVFLVIQVLFIYIFIFCIITLIVSVLFLIPFKKKKLKLYNILWANENFLNTNNLFEYVYLQFLSFILSLIIATSLSYFLLNKSNFINFEINNYILSLFLWFLVFLSLIILIKFLLKNYNKK